MLAYDCKLSYTADGEEPRIVHYQVLTPDSEACIFSFDKRMWCMYQEDYIPGISHVKEKISEWVGKTKPFALVRVVSPFISLHDATPVRKSSVYKLPEKKSEDFTDYADTNGYDFIFLARMKSKDYFDFVG
jgi:hypothetical protein